jgi:CheY-like chemotaxis protein
VGVFAGMNNATYFQRHVSQRPDLIEKLGEFQVMVNNEKDYIATRVAHKLNLTGPAVSTHTACSTSLGAICQAVDSLRAAAAPRQVDVIALLPPDADATPAHGVNRVLVKPLCTADLASQAAADTAQSTRVRVLPKSGSRGRALVVEDNAVNQEMARAMLDMLGFNVTTASNGREGVLAAAADRELDLILMDCQMPVMDGLAAARAIRESETDGARVAIVALTGNAMPGDREACVAAGMDDYLAKPFSLTALKAMIDKWTGSPTPAGAAAGVTTRKS